MSWQSHLQGLPRSVTLSRRVRASNRERSTRVSRLCARPRWLRFLKLSPMAPGKPHRLEKMTWHGNKIEWVYSVRRKWVNNKKYDPVWLRNLLCERSRCESERIGPSNRLSSSLRLLLARLRRRRVLRPSRAVGETDVIELLDRSRMRTRGISRKAIDPRPLMRLSWRYSSWVSGCSRRGMSYRPRPRQSTTLVLLLQTHSFGQPCDKDRRERRPHTSTTVETGGRNIGLDVCS